MFFPDLRFINRQTDAVTVNADGNVMVDAEGNPLARFALPNIDGKSLYASKLLKVKRFIFQPKRDT